MEISIIVPVYNVKKYLSRCLDSILSQTYQDFEVILVNDGSTDGSEKIAEEYAKKYSDKIILLNQDNKGLSAARNTGLRNACGKYILFVDSDDTISARMVEELYNRAEKLQSDLVFCAFHSVDEDGTEIKQIYEPMLESDTVIQLQETKQVLLCQNAAWNKIYRRSIIEENALEFTEGVWYEDIRFTKKYMLYAKNIVYCDKVLYNYLVRPGSIMNSMGDKRNEQILSAIDELSIYYKQRGVYDIYKDEIEFLAIQHVYIVTLVRLVRGNNRELLRFISNEFKKMFPEYKTNKYLPILNKQEKVLFFLLNAKMYKLIAIIFKVRGNLK